MFEPPLSSNSAFSKCTFIIMTCKTVFIALSIVECRLLPSSIIVYIVYQEGTTWLIKCIKFYTCLNYWEAGPSDQKFHIAQVALVRASIGLTADLATSAWFPTWLKWVANSCMVIRRGDVHLRWLALHVYNKWTPITVADTSWIMDN